MSLVKWEKDESVAVLYMDNGANRQNLDFAKEMVGILEEILEDKEIHALIISSTDEKNWSQGVDIEWILARHAEEDLESIKAFMYGMNNVFKKLLLYPVPVIAAINGHAFGNGAILSCACDFRFMRSDRGYFCFPEVDLGIPFLPGMIAWSKKAFPYYKFQEMKYTGKKAAAPELEEHHVIVKACKDVDELNKETMAFAKTFQKSRGIFGEMKKRMHKEITTIMEKEDPEYIDSLFIMIQE
ncbi:MAG: enoyl-CoA hydratase/isomerase family protein [Proteobacteria bacterium]|nr:enoyl-CoA hydratase/isomerase family protein [Pseudomonadota bacterium]